MCDLFGAERGSEGSELEDNSGDGVAGRHSAGAPVEAREPASTFVDGKNSGKEDNRKAIYSFRTRVFTVYLIATAPSNHSRTIFPGFKMSSGSSARLMLRITETASPCSSTRKSIFP